MPTAPMRVPARRARASLSHADDISALSLAEVRERLARNERVLQTSLFSTSPTTSSMNANGNSNMSRSLGSPSAPPALSPTSPSQLSQSPPDPVRGRLLAVRDALRAREAELVAEGMGAMSLDSAGDAMAELSRSPPTRSGKARALDAIRLGEATRGTNAMALPISTSLALGERDYDNQTAQRFASLGLGRNGSSSHARSNGGLSRGLDDEMSRARAAAHYGSDEEDMFDTEEQYADSIVDSAQRGDDGTGLRLDSAKARRAEGYDSDMSSDDTDEFCEGNDEYEGGGRR